MDIATHALLGAAAGYGGGGRRLGRRAALFGAVGASLPDLDVLLRSANDPLFALEWHRHFSHSLLFAVGASIVIGLVLALLLKSHRFATVCTVLIGYTSAVLLDACTSYGTHLLWPFSDTRIAWSIISIVDPVFSIILIAGLTIALVKARPAISHIALAFCAGYLALGAIQQQRASSLFVQTLERDHPELTQHLIKPSFGNILVWRAIGFSQREIIVYAVRPALLGETRIYRGEHSVRPTPDQLTQWSQDSATVRQDAGRFATLAAGLLIQHPSRPQMLGDARFALLPDSLEPLWGIEKRTDSAARHVAYITQRNMTPQRRQRFIQMLKGESHLD